MNALEATIVTVVPVGELDTELVRGELEAKLQACQRLAADVVVTEPVSDEAGAQRLSEQFTARPTELLLLIALRGLSAQVMQTAGRLAQAPVLLWPIAGHFALPSSALVAGALREAGIPVELLYTPPQHPAAFERLRCVAQTATAYARIRRSRIGVVGGLFPNLVACRYDPDTLRARLGTILVPIAYPNLRASMQDILARPAETEQARQQLTPSVTLQPADAPALAAGLRLHLALKQAAADQHLDAFAAECWTGLPRELGLNPCLGFVEDAYTLACEGDVMVAVALLWVRYLNGQRAYVGDLYEVDLDGNLTLMHCGGPCSLAADPSQMVVSPSQTAVARGFETITCRPRLPAGPVTLFRFYGQNCDQMHVALGDLIRCDQSPNLTVRVKLAGSRGDFLSQVLGNHYLVVAGNIRQELKLLAQWLAIRLVET